MSFLNISVDSFVHVNYWRCSPYNIQAQCTKRLNIKEALVNTCHIRQKLCVPSVALCRPGRSCAVPQLEIRVYQLQKVFTKMDQRGWKSKRLLSSHQHEPDGNEAQYNHKWRASILVQFRYGTQNCKRYGINKESILKQGRCSYSFGSPFLRYIYSLQLYDQHSSY